MKISKANLGVIIPQRSAVNASKDDLKGSFDVEEVIPRRNTKVSSNLEEDKTADEVGSLLVKLRSETGRFFTLSLRQFFALPLAASTMNLEDIKKEMTGNIASDKMKPLYNSLLEKDGDKVEFPKKIEFTYVADRVNGAGKSVYPASAYPAFQEKAKEMEEQNKLDIQKGLTTDKFTIMDVYNDYNFIRSLEDMEARKDIPNLQAQKILVIKEL
jgi:hypothetical protein